MHFLLGVKVLALARAEGYMFGPNPLTKDVLQQFKTFVNWMVSDLYLSKVDSLSKAQDLIMKSGLKPQQTELLKQAGNWLISDLYISKTVALAKAETYLVTAQMTPQLFQALKEEYTKQVGKLNKLEALKKAENAVLGL